MYFEIRATKDGLTHTTVKRSAVIAVAAARVMQKDGYAVVVADEDGVVHGMHELDQLLRFRLRTAAGPRVTSMGKPLDTAAMPSRQPSQAESARPIALRLMESVARYGRTLGFH